MKKSRNREPWWTWHWDRAEIQDVMLPMAQVIRWRRGSLLTVYKWVTSAGDVHWLFYGPFNLQVGISFGHPMRKVAKMVTEADESDEHVVAPHLH